MFFTRRQIKGVVIAILLLLSFSLGINVSAMVMHNKISNTDDDIEDWDGHFAPFEPANTGYSVLVDLDNMTLYLYESAIIIKSWPVSGGSKKNPSPTGNWEISEIDNWGSGFGGSWIALNVPWGQYGIHGTVEPWALGKYNISHGCIRMNNKDVAELKAYMSIGIPVHIKHDSAPFRSLRDGHIGSDVLLLQIMLKQLGYYNNNPSGIFGKDTFDAVCQFQADENITVDGIVGYESWCELLGYAGSM